MCFSSGEIHGPNSDCGKYTGNPFPGALKVGFLLVILPPSSHSCSLLTFSLFSSPFLRICRFACPFCQLSLQFPLCFLSHSPTPNLRRIPDVSGSLLISTTSAYSRLDGPRLVSIRHLAVWYVSFVCVYEMKFPFPLRSIPFPILLLLALTAHSSLIHLLSGLTHDRPDQVNLYIPISLEFTILSLTWLGPNICCRSEKLFSLFLIPFHSFSFLSFLSLRP